MVRFISRIVLSHVGGFLLFLILLAIGNILLPTVNNEIYRSVVNALNANLALIFLMMFLGLFNDVLWAFNFPFNLLGPISGSLLGAAIVTFIYRLWEVLSYYTKVKVPLPLAAIYLVVIMMTLVFGYLTIFIRGGKSREDYEEKQARYRDMKEKIDVLNTRIEKLDDKIKKKEIEWKDVGLEFKKGLLNLGQSINKLFEDSKVKDRNADKDKDKKPKKK